MSRFTLSPDNIVRFLADSPTPLTKREIAQAFHIKGEDGRIILKEILRDLEHSGAIIKQAGQVYSVPKALPTVAMVEIIDIDADGDVLAKPTEWDEHTQGDLPRIEVQPDAQSHAIGVGDRALARLKRLSDRLYEAEIIRTMEAPQNRVLGVVERIGRGFILKPTDRKAKYEFDIAPADLNGARVGDLCTAEVQPSRGLRNKRVRILESIGSQDDPKAISLVAMHMVGIKPEFPKAVIDETKPMDVPDLKGREDLRDIPLVTIDGADARDFDDAVFAEELEDGGFHLMVAIADVAHYVTFHSHLNKEALRRGNSTYFPDRVVPMLPERLSNELCSLMPRVNRATLAVHMWIDQSGKLHKYKFVRGLMRSEARLTYEQVQAARDGVIDEVTGPLMERVINPLYKAYEVLWKAREERGALDLDLPERRIVINEKNEMAGVALRARLDSHKLIEEFMILANVAAAQALEARNAPCVYRVHDRPSPDKLDAVREFIEGFGLSLPKGQVLRPAQINQLLHKAAELPYSQVISQVVLRCQSQAHYNPENAGHFGLALQRYAHFTSPIRRYADLLIHRALIRAYDLGPGGLHDEEMVRMEEMAQHISETERKSMEAERSAVDRFTAAYLVDKIDNEFEARITGVTRFGLFVALAETGADGIIPIRSLPDDFYDHDETQHALIGRRSGRLYRLGAAIRVRLIEADPVTGSMMFHVTNMEGADIPGLQMAAPRPFPGRPGHTKRSWAGKNKDSREKRGPSGGRRDNSDGPRPPRGGKSKSAPGKGKKRR
ncbi:MAG TPA: ribonuclease R [Micavibrio sp.]